METPYLGENKGMTGGKENDRKEMSINVRKHILGQIRND